MKSLRNERWANVTAAFIIAAILVFLFGALSAWNDKLAEIEYPADEFGHEVNYPDGFWFSGWGLFVAVSISAGLLAFVVRNAVITLDGYNNPKGSRQLRIWGYAITGFGVPCSFLSPNLGPIVFIVGVACLVVSIQQKTSS
jgi:hypothetical protein